MTENPEFHLPPETITQLIERTVEVCTVATDEREAWIQQLIEDRLTHSRHADVFTFYNALLAICQDKFIELLQTNPYREAVEGVQARIDDYRTSAGPVPTSAEPALPRQVLHKLVDKTILVCTRRPGQRDSWTETLMVERDRYPAGTDIQGFCDALLAVCNGNEVLITPENRYYKFVGDVQAAIATYTADTPETEPEPDPQPEAAPLPPLPNVEDDPNEMSSEEAFLLCQQTLIYRIVGTQMEFDLWISHLETRQDQSTKHKTAVELISALIDILQTGQADDLPDDNPYAPLVKRFSADIQWTEPIMAHSLAILTRDRNNHEARAKWLHELRRLQDMEEGQSRVDRVEFLGAIDMLISENEVRTLTDGHRLEVAWERMLRRAEAYRNRKQSDVTTIIEKTKAALATVNRGKRVRWTTNVEQLLARTARTRDEAMSEHQRDMRGFLEAILAILKGEPVGNLWGNAYQDDIESLRDWQRDLETQQAVQQLIQSSNPQAYIAQNESLVLSDRFLMALQAFVTDRAQEASRYEDDQATLALALAHRGADLGRKLIAYRDAKQESLEKSFQPQPLDILRVLYEQDGDMAFRQKLLDDSYPDALKEGLTELYQQTGDLMFPALLEREGYPAEFCSFMLDFVRGMD